MFYTRPNLPQLGIDLVEVGGGGSCPSQFYGHTADGRHIYMRYRDGWFAVWAGTDDEMFEEELLSAHFGPSLNGDLLLEQACDLAGITIRGEKPTLTEAEWRDAAEERDVMDWSGRTTYWRRDILISRKGGQRLAEALAATFPDMRIVEGTWLTDPEKRVYIRRELVGECEDAVNFGFGADERALAQLTSGEHTDIAALDRAFAHHLMMRIRWNERWPLTQNFWEARGLPVPEAVRRPSHIELPDWELNSHFDTKFKTGDPAGEQYARKLVATIETCFGRWAERVDLENGQVLGEPIELNWYSLDLLDWCSAAPHRYLFWLNAEEGSARKIGIRPCRAPAGS
jgi:hypothetical protein